jgi:hypothetical protein
MAESDLIARKILGTEPTVGFGESSVLPYRRTVLDTTGFEAMGRAKARDEARKEARRKNNEDYYNLAIKNLPVYEREFDAGLNGWKNDIINEGFELSRQNKTPSASWVQNVMNFNQAAANTKQLKADLAKIDSMPLSKYANKESIKGAALKRFDELAQRVNQGDRSALGESIRPNVDDPEHFLFDAFLNDKYGNRPDTTINKEYVSTNDKGERIVGNKFTAKFVTTDKNGKVTPGIDKSVIDEALYSDTTDQDTLGFRNALFSLADKQIMSKALELKDGDPTYKDMGVNQIVQSISANPNDSHYKDFNRKKITEDVLTKKLEAFQRVSTDKQVGTLNEYNKGSGDGDDDKPKIETTYDQVRNFNLNKKDSTGKAEVTEGWVPEIKSLYDKKDKKVRFESPVYIDADTNERIKDVGNKELYGIELQQRPVNKKGQIVVGEKGNILKNPEYDYKWYVSGSYNDGTSDKPKIKNVLIPYENVKPQMKSAYGIDLDERDPSEISDLELISIIKKNYPKASGEERLNIFNKIRGK